MNKASLEISGKWKQLGHHVPQQQKHSIANQEHLAPALVGLVINFFPTPHWRASATLSVVADAALGS